MGIVGNLRTMQLAELLQWLSQSKKTGTLVINKANLEKKIFFKDGFIVSSASNQPEEYLGHFLVSHGLINEKQLARAIEIQEKTKILLGKILVGANAIAETDLHRMLRLKAEESIYAVFNWEEGDFKFLDNQLPEGEMVPMRLDVTAIVLEGAQRVDEWGRIRELIPNSDAIPVSVADLDDPTLSPGERRILELVDDSRTVEEIRLQTHSSDFHVCRVLFEQSQKGRLKVVTPRWRSSGSGPGLGGAATSAAGLLAAGRQYLDQKAYEAALRHLRAARSLEPDSPDTQQALTEAEKRIREDMERSGVTLSSVPRLSASMENFTASKITPQEGFMLTRINGSYDIQSILKITPMPQLDALLIFWKLAQAGYVSLEGSKK
jgi:tetratricopeptide (TPR) repeat protein